MEGCSSLIIVVISSRAPARSVSRDGPGKRRREIARPCGSGQTFLFAFRSQPAEALPAALPSMPILV
ncbi:hypothetical protein [Lysobacter gummosus]|uniref:hypothetical protein n=1 Tax=Lysobacter gummosus TaxID=262324 RepID=UPI00364576DB